MIIDGVGARRSSCACLKAFPRACGCVPACVMWKQRSPVLSNEPVKRVVDKSASVREERAKNRWLR